MPYRFIKRFIARSKSLSDADLMVMTRLLKLILESHSSGCSDDLLLRLKKEMTRQYVANKDNLLNCRLSSYDMKEVGSGELYEHRAELHSQVFALTYFFYLVSKGHKNFNLSQWTHCPFHGTGDKQRVAYANGKLTNKDGIEVQYPFTKRGCECHIAPLSYFHMPRL